MALPRSTSYDEPTAHADDTTVGDEFETYGYRRVGAALQQVGTVVNHKKVRRLMREH